MRTTRLAPSPTGALHLGNARTFLINWLLARQQGWRIVLRIDDLDAPRVRPQWSTQIIDDLTWLGLTWDAGPDFQAPRSETYRAAARQLVDAGLAYPCVCTRGDIERSASAPHADDGAAVYPGHCRGRFRSINEAIEKTGRRPKLRFAVPPGIVQFTDAFLGPRSADVAAELGDFLIEQAHGTAAYQLATVLDDAAAGVSDIVRGDDLIDSTPRQILLYRALGLPDQIPSYTHVPLVVGSDNRRLAKRHGDVRIAGYRERGVPAGRVVALLAKWCGIDAGVSAMPGDLVGRFHLNKLPPQRLMMTAADDAFLLCGTPATEHT
jgi:glutamyl-tRNA synthetase